MNKQYLIQLTDKSGTIADARTFYRYQDFRAALSYEWPEEYTLRFFDVTDPLRPVEIFP